MILLSDAVPLENTDNTFSVTASPDKSSNANHLHFFVMDNILTNFYNGNSGNDEVVINFKKDYYKIAKVLVISRGYFSNPKVYGCNYNSER